MEAKRATVRDMRRRNRAVLLSRLYHDGPSSRQELTGVTGLSAASVSNLVGEMLEQGLVEEAGAVDSDGGRPRTLLRVRPGYAYVVGVDVGETRVRVELFDLAMTGLAKADHPIESARPAPETVVRHILAGLDAVTAAAGIAPDALLGVGVGVPGVVEQGASAVVHAQTLGWEGVPLEAMLRAGTGASLYFDNGAKTLGRAEMWFGAGRGARHVVVALVGSGVGAAVLTDGVSYRGVSSSASEWGHTTIVYGGRRCRCGAEGCLEAYVGAEAVLDRWRVARRGRVPGPDEESGIAALVAGAERSESAARVLEETAGYLGAGIANLINLFNPERIVLGGWAGLALGDVLLPRIREVAAAHALRHPYGQASIELCRLGPDAVSVGAATLPVAKLLADGGSR
ncbi:ROK family transcriptional regulator [Phytohabitans sp. ZYX-F-186]|uniref:ROK family transcriptional regulator n=1 Tax=Phytohabitans maris TaxID=3071409 RepID=A0ABU0ZI60_9ACTN|nr:ROK family transcriptional regulator [Phytohabitans sp. ZYX-F-186]MDQ7906216.1 ROK family transcriptional regulator [Phytohabitans sp. ZYX-F-186]